MVNPASSSPVLPPPPNPTYHHHHNSSPTSSNPPSPELKPKLEIVAAAAASSSVKKNPPLPWTHQETISLIQSYQEKWYSLKKGQLKANQWEEVAVNVAARCGYDEPSKSATQCRHKIEKLRKRYRSERVRPYPNSWQYFELMDSMERGPFPLSEVKNPNTNSTADYNDNESDSDDESFDYGAVDVRKNKLKSINNIVRGDLGLSSNGDRNVSRLTMDRNFVGGAGMGSERGYGVLKNPRSKKRRGIFYNGESDEEEREDDEEEEAQEEGEEEDRDGGKKLAAEIRGFSERFMKMENEKIEMMQETERCRLEMEQKKMEMILEAQRKIVDTIGRAFGVHKKVKMTREI